MKCRHLRSTITRAYLDDGTPLAIHQCDNCGVAMPETDTGEPDIWQLPEFDTRASERGYERLWNLLFGKPEGKLNKIVRMVKTVNPYERKRNIR